MNSRAFNSSLFAMALGVLLAFKMTSFGSLVDFILVPILAMFWPYLSLGQNLSIALFRMLLELPHSYRLWVRGHRLLGFVYELMGGFLEYIEEGLLEQFRERVGSPYPSFGVWCLLTLLVFIVLHYLIYRVFRRMGIYNRLPFGRF